LEDARIVGERSSSPSTKEKQVSSVLAVVELGRHPTFGEVPK
jgi:hypothetical protein